MAEYLPRFKPGDVITAGASAAISGGQLVAVTGNDTVGPAGASAVSVGTAGMDTASGARVQYYGRGTVHRLLTSGAVTAGDLVEAAAAGTVITHAVGTNDGRVFGVALTGGASGATISVMEV